MGIIQFFGKYAKRLAGVGLYSIWNWLYDNPIWLTVIGFCGVFEGSILLTLGAVLNNFVFLVIYQKNESDWLGVKAFKEMKKNGDKWALKAHNHRSALIRIIAWAPAMIFRLMLWALRKNNVLAFIVLSIHGDSFIATTILRGKVGGKLTQRDYLTFLGSTIFSCTYWSLRNTVILGALKGAWELIKHITT